MANKPTGARPKPSVTPARAAKPAGQMNKVRAQPKHTPMGKKKGY